MLYKISSNKSKVENGSVMIVTVLFIPLILMILLFLIDVGGIYITQTKLQNITDIIAESAALDVSEVIRIRAEEIARETEVDLGSNPLVYLTNTDRAEIAYSSELKRGMYSRANILISKNGNLREEDSFKYNIKYPGRILDVSCQADANSELTIEVDSEISYQYKLPLFPLLTGKNNLGLKNKSLSTIPICP